MGGVWLIFFLTLSPFLLAAGHKKGEKEIMHGNTTSYPGCLLWPLHYKEISPNHSPCLPGFHQEYIGSDLVIKVIERRKTTGYINLDCNHKWICDTVWDIIICITTPNNIFSHTHYLVNSLFIEFKIKAFFFPNSSSI